MLAGHERSSYVLATKVYFPMSDSDRGLSAAQIHKQIDASLQRLRTDYVDLYQCHRYDDDTPLEETMGALSEVVAGRQGAPHRLQRVAGRSGSRQSLALPGVERWVSSQPQYSILWRKPEAELIPLCEREGISQIVWSPLAQGVLTGKYAPGEPPPAGLARRQREHGRLHRRLHRAARAARPCSGCAAVADGAGLTLAQLALAWVLRQPNVASAIVGASRPEQVRANASASGITLSADTLAAIDEAIGDVAIR